MVAATAYELADDLDSSFQWRRTELASLKAEVEHIAADDTSPKARMLLRASVTLLYAHWEGFVRDACEGYADLVARRRLKYRELNEALTRTVVKRLASRASTDPRALESLIKAIHSSGDIRAEFPRRGLVETKANLRHQVACELMSSLGLEVDLLETHGHLIDRTLCDSRNEIAHGRDAFPRAADVLNLHGEVLKMMDAVRTAVLRAAFSSEYKLQTA